MIKRLFQTVKFLFTGRVDGYISIGEAFQIRESACDHFWKKICMVSIKEIANKNIFELNESIEFMRKKRLDIITETVMANYYEEHIKKLESIKLKLHHDIELLG